MDEKIWTEKEIKAELVKVLQKDIADRINNLPEYNNRPEVKLAYKIKMVVFGAVLGALAVIALSGLYTHF